jgi:hypothetical protein
MDRRLASSSPCRLQLAHVSVLYAAALAAAEELCGDGIVDAGEQCDDGKRPVLAVSCFGTGTQNLQFFTGGATFSCGQTIVDREVTYDSRTGQGHAPRISQGREGGRHC